MTNKRNPTDFDLDALWAHHHAEWRDPMQITSQWKDAALVDPALLHSQARGDWWEVLAQAHATLLVTREYEHLVMAIGVINDTPTVSYVKLPHPSGIAVDTSRQIIHIASSRNPNQVFDWVPATTTLQRLDVDTAVLELEDHPLVPLRSRYYPGCFFMHDLAIVAGELHANAVGQNVVVRLHDDGRYDRVWWPHCIETEEGPVFGQNHIQLNSIAAGPDLQQSYFSASADRISARRPGHKNFPVNRRGVIFSGTTREPILWGLTRPHSARLHRGQLWVDNSGYGEFGRIEKGTFTSVARLPGWTRGLGFCGHIAFVGTSRIIPRFQQYAPGLDVNACECGIHAVDIESGVIRGTLIWPHGNQLFAVEPVPAHMTRGFPFRVGSKRTTRREKILFYTFQTQAS